MGGRSKQRAKNITKPSSSSRNAEFAATNTFVGFASCPEIGMGPVSSGNFPIGVVLEPTDSNLSPEFQLVFRKMNKKDVMTKRKALQEFTEIVLKSGLEDNKYAAALWSEYYQSLAANPDHIIREHSQIALKTLMSKCKRAAAPYIKQLIPIWLHSHFDNYRPAAVIASTAFQEIFATKTDRTIEVLLHCQSEIFDFALHNLTYHTTSTVASKSLAPGEAEQKYQRLVVGSLKMLGFFIEKTNGKLESSSAVCNELNNLLSKPKFWSFGKNQNFAIRAAWFEFICQVLQCTYLKEVINAEKKQLTTLTFQNIDEYNPVVASNVWNCMLLIQENYNDWYDIIDVPTAVLPKILYLLRKRFHHNTIIICPNMFKLFANIFEKGFLDNNYHVFCKQFFDSFKKLVIANPESELEMMVIVKSYFECLRYFFEKFYNIDKLNDNQLLLLKSIMNENVINSFIWFLENKSLCTKYYFEGICSLIVFWKSHKVNLDGQNLYKQLLEMFWAQVHCILLNISELQNINEIFLRHMTTFLQELRVANPKQSKESVNKNIIETTFNSPIKCVQLNKVMDVDLKNIVIKLVSLCLFTMKQEVSTQKVMYIRELMGMFYDDDFYEGLSPEGTILDTLKIFTSLLEKAETEKTYDLLISIIFEILQKLESCDRCSYIKEHLLKDTRKCIKFSILQQLLSLPYCNDSNLQSFISQPEMRSLIIEMAHDIARNNSKKMLNILYKCFFQTENGKIIIDPCTVNEILNIFCDAFCSVKRKEIIDTCGIFLGKVFPIICLDHNTSENKKFEVFGSLFEFTLTHLKPNEYISKDILWEVTSSWQIALSSGNIHIDSERLQLCCALVEKCSKNIEANLCKKMADILCKFIHCSTENILEKEDRLNKINAIVLQLFYSEMLSSENISLLQDFSVILESIRGYNSVGHEFININCCQKICILGIVRRTLLNIHIAIAMTPQISSNPDTSDGYSSKSKSKKVYLTEWSHDLFASLVEYCNIATAGYSILSSNLCTLEETTYNFVLTLFETVKTILSNDCEIITTLVENILLAPLNKTSSASCRTIQLLMHNPKYAVFEENAAAVFTEYLTDSFTTQKAFKSYACAIQYLLPYLSPKTITLQNQMKLCDSCDDSVKIAMYHCLIINTFKDQITMDASQKSIGNTVLQYISTFVEIHQSEKEYLLYNTVIHEKPFHYITITVDFINLLKEVIRNFPYQLTMKNWDTIRLGLSSWTLSISKSVSDFSNPKVYLFIIKVYKLYQTLKMFIISEKTKSSTAVISEVIEEWEGLFARDVDLILFKTFLKICNEDDLRIDIGCHLLLLDNIVPAVELLNYDFVYSANKDPGHLNNLLNFLFKQLSNPLHSIRTCCAYIVRQITKYLVIIDAAILEKNIDTFEASCEITQTHFLKYFEEYLTLYEMPLHQYLNQFSYKLAELTEFTLINENEAWSYLLLWDCIIYACANSPVIIRSTYTSWIQEHRYENNFLHFLFRAMPLEILRNHNSKLMSNDSFKTLDYLQIKDPKLSIENYACHMFTEILRKLPTTVRKWWNSCYSRQKTFVDKLTTNFVSPIICSEELRFIASKKGKYENMQIKVHHSTREVLAVYSIDEARMELIITLAPNYPLGAVKIDCGKQIGGRSSSRNIGLQLSIFLIHQNGTIFDGLSLWKNNLDRKFEGVEECYICYAVIHQDTCQLPKLSCRTCKKKFHGPCLYKWFTTSNKSTCPICRNVF